MLQRSGHPFRLHPTISRGDAARIARDLAAEGRGAVLLAVGGDGTVHEVANGLLAAGLGAATPALAVLPAGTGNDFARQLGIPRDPALMPELLAHGATTVVDAGHLSWPGGEEWFVNVASFGFTGLAARHAARMGKRFGGASYVLAAVRAIVAHRDWEVTIGVAHDPPTVTRICAGVVANTAWFGSGMHVAPGARTDDGCLDLLTVASAGRVRLLGLLAGVFGGWHCRSPAVHRRLVDALSIAWSGDFPVEADGEVVAAGSPLRIAVRPAALRVVVPGPQRR